MLKDVRKKIEKIENELSSLSAKIEKNNLVIRESEETTDRLRRKTHDLELDQVLHSSKENADLLQVLTDHLLEAEQLLEDSRLRKEAFEKEKIRLEDALKVAEDELKAVQAKELAAKMPGLISEYNRAMEQAFDAATKLKIIGVRCMELGHKEPLRDVDQNIFQIIREIPIHYPLGKITNTLNPSLVVLHFDDKNKEQIISDLLK